jgi:ribosomal protein L37AE/L43A
MQREQECPECGGPTSFGRSASTILNAGLKIKWRCSDCGYTTVQIGDVVDTGTA